MPEPVTPRPAATLVLLRDRPGEGFETLLIQRHHSSRFAGGDHVFPGGRVEADELPADGESLCAGLAATEAARRLGGTVGPSQALAHWAGAVRETFEEVGVLLACDASGALIGVREGDERRQEAYRRACHADHRAFWAMLRAEGLRPAVDRLVYFAHWITPEENPIRFDTRFFAAVVPPATVATPDGKEIVDARWIAPGEALDAMARREISLRLPTIENLKLLAGGATAADVVARLGGREVPTIRPRLLTVEGRRVAVLPGDPRWY